MIQGCIAVTDNDWFDQLAGEPQRDEVNFWNPSGKGFCGGRGMPFFFKLKRPRHAIGGFAFVDHFTRLPERKAWDFFGEKNGAYSFEQLAQRLAGLRGRQPAAGTLREIGCTVLVHATFLPPHQWIAPPADWAPNNVRYAFCDLTQGEGARIWRECRERAAMLGLALPDSSSVTSIPGGWSESSDVQLRRGQGAFRSLVTDAYGRRCAITGERSLPVLEAVHIKPYKLSGEHEINNGLLLRADLHALFDDGYLTVTPQFRVEVSPRLKADYGNGRIYYDCHGQELRSLPRVALQQPHPELLRWHNEHVYKG